MVDAQAALEQRRRLPGQRQRIEFDVQAAVTEELLLFGSFGYTDTEIIRSSRRPQDEGNRTPKNQEYTLNAGVEYRRPLVGGFDLALRVDYEHRGEKYWHPDNLNPMDDFGLVNARLGLDGERFGVTLWGKNLSDELFWQDYNASAFSGLPFGDIGPPCGRPAEAALAGR